MAHLIMTKGERVGMKVPLQKVTCMGRGLDMDVRLDELTVSKRHARVLCNDKGEYIIEDLASSNGSFVNGVQVTTKRLKDGDEIRVGNNEFVFHAESEDSAIAPPDRTLLDIGEDTSSTSVISSVDMLQDTPSVLAGRETTVDELMRANFRLGTVLEIFQSIGTGLDEDELLNKILDKLFEVFPETARGFIILRDPETGQLTPRASRMEKHSRGDEERLEISETILEHVLDRREAVLSADAMHDERFASSQSILDFQMRSMMCAPLMDEEKEVLGFIWLDTQRIASNYDQEGLNVLASIANQAALTIANARLHSRLVRRERLEQDLRNARRIQNSFLPTEPPAVEGYEFVDWYGTALEVGGDFYDFISLPEGRVLVAVGDVSGKGITAALMMAKMASNLRFYAGAHNGPGGLLGALNQVALSSATDMFITMLIMSLDFRSNTVQMSNAGHCYPLVRRSDGRVERLEGGNGFPVGITQDAEFPETSFTVQPGEILCIFSDGIIEAMDENGKLFGYKKLSDAMERADNSPLNIVKDIQRAVREHAGAAPQSDDLTLVCFGRVDGSEEG